MQQTPNRLLRRAEVQTLTGLGSSSIYLLMKSTDPDLRFPQPIKIGSRSRWPERDIKDWVERQSAKRAAR